MVKGKTAQYLDWISEVLDGGRGWTQRVWYNGHGKWCLEGAIRRAQIVHRVPQRERERAEAALLASLPAPFTTLREYNDDCDGFENIAALIATARTFRTRKWAGPLRDPLQERLEAARVRVSAAYMKAMRARYEAATRAAEGEDRPTTVSRRDPERPDGVQPGPHDRVEHRKHELVPA
jgi:hypothetical protein